MQQPNLRSAGPAVAYLLGDHHGRADRMNLRALDGEQPRWRLLLGLAKTGVDLPRPCPTTLGGSAGIGRSWSRRRMLERGELAVRTEPASLSLHPAEGVPDHIASAHA